MYSMPRFPSPGSSRVEFPGFIGTIKALRLPAGLPAAFRFLGMSRQLHPFQTVRSRLSG